MPTLKNLPISALSLEFMVNLGSCTAIEDLKNLALESPLSTSPLRSHAAFRQLLKQEPSLHTMLDFIEDSELHCAESRNLQYLVASQLGKIVMGHDKVDLFGRWLEKHIALGLCSHEVVLSILTAITGYSSNKAKRAVYQALYRAIFDGLQKCGLYNQSTQICAYHALLGNIPQGRLPLTMQKFGIEIVEMHAQSDTERQRSSLRLLLRDWEISQELSGFESEPTLLQTGGASQLFRLLETYPRDLVQYCLKGASRKLFSFLLMLDGPGEAVVNQIRKLSDLGFNKPEAFTEITVWEQIENEIARKDFKFLASYVAGMDSQSVCRFVLKYWYASLVGQSADTENSSFASSLLEKFDDIARARPHQKAFVSLLSAVHYFGYGFGIHFQELLIGLLRALNLPATIVAVMTAEHLTKLKFHPNVVLAQIRYFLAFGEKRSAYLIFRGYRCLTLEQIPELADIIIGNPDLQPNTALYYHYQRARYIKGRNMMPAKLPLGLPRVERLNRMALAYAKAEHLSPRQAYRLTHACYHACKAERLPIQPDMAKALTFAGCIRYLEEWHWMSTKRFEWILSVVREVEGEETATRLDELAWQWRGSVIDRQRLQQSEGGPISERLCLTYKAPPEESHEAPPEKRNDGHWWLRRTPSGHPPSFKWRKGDGGQGK